MGMFGFPVLPPDPQNAWEEEQKKREREMMEALRSSENATLPSNPGSVDTPSNDYLDDYAEHVRSMPRVEDHKPSTLRKILGGLAGTVTGSPNLARTISWNKYDTAMGEWNKRKDAMKDVADIGEEARRTDVQVRGQDIGVEESRRQREFEQAQDELARQARWAEITQGQEYQTGERLAGETFDEKQARERRQFESGESRLNRELDRERNNMMRDYYASMGNREAELTPGQQLDTLKLGAATLASRYPDWQKFMGEDGMPFYDPPTFGKDEYDREYAAFQAALDNFVEEQGSSRVTRRDVPPAGAR